MAAADLHLTTEDHLSTCATLHQRTACALSLSPFAQIYISLRHRRRHNIGLPSVESQAPPLGPPQSSQRTRSPCEHADALHTDYSCVRHARAAQNIECGKECSCSLAAPGFPTTPPNERLHQWRPRQRCGRPVERLWRLESAHR